ncbi:MAG TPA: hypothetical protein VFC11_02930, partial [Methylocella sp.]|nr:hypothetical protein [Methylocella sp.]
SGCVNVTAGDGDCCHTGGMAGTVLRQDVDRIDAIMIMRSGRSRLRPGPQQAACHGEHRSSKTGISRVLHLDLIFSGNRRMMASLKLRLPLSGDFSNANFATHASMGSGAEIRRPTAENTKFSRDPTCRKAIDVRGLTKNSAPIGQKCFT